MQTLKKVVKWHSEPNAKEKVISRIALGSCILFTTNNLHSNVAKALRKFTGVSVKVISKESYAQW